MLYSSTNSVSPCESITGVPVTVMNSHVIPIDLWNYFFNDFFKSRYIAQQLTSLHSPPCEWKYLLWDERRLNIDQRTSARECKHWRGMWLQSYIEPVYRRLKETWKRILIGSGGENHNSQIDTWSHRMAMSHKCSQLLWRGCLQGTLMLLTVGWWKVYVCLTEDYKQQICDSQIYD